MFFCALYATPLLLASSQASSWDQKSESKFTATKQFRKEKAVRSSENQMNLVEVTEMKFSKSTEEVTFLHKNSDLCDISMVPQVVTTTAEVVAMVMAKMTRKGGGC